MGVTFEIVWEIVQLRLENDMLNGFFITTDLEVCEHGTSTCSVNPLWPDSAPQPLFLQESASA